MYYSLPSNNFCVFTPAWSIPPQLPNLLELFTLIRIYSNRQILNDKLIDSISKYAQAFYLNRLGKTEIADNLSQFFSHHVTFKLAILDNSTEFENIVITKLSALHNIKINFCSTNHSRSNCTIETRKHQPK